MPETEVVNGTPGADLAGMTPRLARRQFELAALGIKLAHDAMGAWCDAARDEAELQLAAVPPEVDLMIAGADAQAVADLARELLVPYVHAWEAISAALAEVDVTYADARRRGRMVPAILDNLYRPHGV